jgi:site-specific recombinase XerC
MGSTALIVGEQSGSNVDQIWSIVSELVLDGIASVHTRRAYAQALEEFLIWFRDEPGRQFNKATVQAYRAELETKGLAPSSINVRLSAIRRLALEAADNGRMAPELAAGIGRARGAQRHGVRLGHWLTGEQAERLLVLPDLSTLKGQRDHAVLSLLLGAGLRRSEVSGLDWQHLQQREGRWLLADLVGKQGRIRSVPIPEWAHAAVNVWRETAGLVDGPVFRSLTRYGYVAHRRLSSQAVFLIVVSYTKKLGISAAPCDRLELFRGPTPAAAS